MKEIRILNVEKLEKVDNAERMQLSVRCFGGENMDASDGYHTFTELYEFRKLYNASLFNEWAAQGKYNVIKSKRHFDGEECFGGGWFIVMAQLPTGQISNHYPNEDWDLFKCEETITGVEWDGHTPEDVAKRLEALIKTV